MNYNGRTNERGVEISLKFVYTAAERKAMNALHQYESCINGQANS